jgi:phosphonate transport system permease protein
VTASPASAHPALRDPAWVGRIAWTGVALVLLWPLLVATEFKPWELFEARNLKVTGDFLASFLPPAHAPDFLLMVARETWRTVAIATAGMALALLIAVPLTLLATSVLSVSALPGRMARLPFALRQLVRAVLVVLRSVPELVWALVFVRVVGLGPTAGVLAIALTYGGMLGKVYAEILESGDTHATQTLLRNGSSRLQAFLYGLLPQNAAELTSYTVYRWECAIRSSVVLGFVGAGGLGQQLDNSMKMFHGGEVLTMLAVFVALVALADAVSASLRRAPTRAGPGHRWNAGAIAAAGALLLAAVSFATLGLQWAQFFSLEALRSMGRFVAEFFPPDLATAFLLKVWMGTWETLAMSALGTLLAALAGLALALPASRLHEADAARGRGATRLLLNALRSVPELVWAALLLIAAGLGPFAGTLALAAHTTGVLGRLFAEAIENAPSGPGDALRAQGVGNLRVFLYATLPQVLPQLMSYTLYRWENNIRAAAVLGVVGAGGLGQLLAFHMGLFHMGKTATILGAMLLLVALVDLASLLARRALTR